jgi:hypothetical protein
MGYRFRCGKAYPKSGEQSRADVYGYNSNLFQVDLGLGAQKLDRWSEGFSVTSVSRCMK